jgi:hypothetical protein
MSERRRKPVVPLAYQRAQAAEALGVSDDFFDREIRDKLRCVYVASIRLWPVSELERWLATNSSDPPDAARESS